jgi:hypothetical protein
MSAGAVSKVLWSVFVIAGLTRNPLLLSALIRGLRLGGRNDRVNITLFFSEICNSKKEVGLFFLPTSFLLFSSFFGDGYHRNIHWQRLLDNCGYSPAITDLFIDFWDTLRKKIL